MYVPDCAYTQTIGSSQLSFMSYRYRSVFFKLILISLVMRDRLTLLTHLSSTPDLLPSQIFFVALSFPIKFWPVIGVSLSISTLPIWKLLAFLHVKLVVLPNMYWSRFSSREKAVPSIFPTFSKSARLPLGNKNYLAASSTLTCDDLQELILVSKWYLRATIW